MSLENAIIDKLKTSSIYNGNEENPNIILFSDVDTFPNPPYVVVKPENGVIDSTRSYRIIVHNKQGYQDELRNYTLIELDQLLLSGHIKDEEGARYKLQAAGYTDVTPEGIDNTYFMERIYTAPLTIRN
jgi:hypothetical protein